MLRRILIQIAILFAALSLSVQATADDASGPDQLLQSVSENVLEAVAQYGEDYDNAPDVLEAELLNILDPALDFTSFSRGVMGKYYAQATPEQRNAFITEFKATLVELYTSALVAAKIEAISIDETSSSRPGRANIAMKAESQTGASYTLQYNMAQNDDGQWLIRNIILDGVNIGLTYRNQFRSAMETENEDLERVIQLWPQIIEGQ